MTQTAKTSKVVHILGRAQFKTSGYILYRVQAEVAGVRHEPHDVTVVDGKITGCSECKAWEYKHACCHTDRVRQAEQDEALRFNPWHGSNRDAERPIDERGLLNGSREFRLLR